MRPGDLDHGLCNWGRWGPDDERGTLNLITEAVRGRAAAEVRLGLAVSLALPIDPTPVLSGPFAAGVQDASPVRQVMVYTGSPAIAAADIMMVTNHHPRSTHIDALAHIPHDGKVYPGKPLAESVTMAGVRHGSTTAFAAGITTRGVLLDLAAAAALPSGHEITGHDLDEAEQRVGVRLEPGDALVLRTGWTMVPDAAAPMPGVGMAAIKWMHDRGVSLYAGDIGDAHPPLNDEHPAPLHGVALPLLGMPLIDAVATEELARTCTRLGRYAFLLVIAPPRIHGLSGIPVNPIALF